MMRKRLFGILALSLTAVSCCVFGACNIIGGESEQSSQNIQSQQSEQSSQSDQGMQSSSDKDSMDSQESEDVEQGDSNKDENESDSSETVVGSVGLAYALNDDGKSYSITGIGECTDTDIVIPANYKGLPVTTIVAWAFFSCDSLTSVEIGDNVTTIGESAFNDCSNLIFNEYGNCHYLGNESNPYYALIQVSDMDDSNYTIYESTNILADAAFSSCFDLKNIEIPDSVTKIGLKAFYRCDSLTNITVLKNNTVYQSIDGNLYNKDGNILIQYAIGKTTTEFVIPNGVTTISEWAFYSCDSLESVVISNGVSTIGEWAFFDCSCLTSIVIPNSVTTIGRYAFVDCFNLIFNEYGNCQYLGNESNPYHALIQVRSTEDGNYTIHENTNILADAAFSYCWDLTSIDIPNSVTTIGSLAFSDCNSLMSVVIGDGVTAISWNAFVRCSSLTNITVSQGNTAYQSIDGNLYTKDGSTLIMYAIGKMETEFVIPNGVSTIGEHAVFEGYNLTSVEIPNSVTIIGASAFYGCSSLTSVAIPDGVITIGNGAFSLCTSLKSVEISDSVTTIGGSAFSSCSSLTSVVIGDSVLMVGDYAFASCANLTSVEIPSSVILIGDYAFAGCVSLMNITVSQDNSVYQSIDGNLYTKDGSILMQYAIGKTATEFVIPTSVTTIERYAFAYCSNLTSVIIPTSVTTIERYAFAHCSNLTSVIIPDSVTKLEAFAFHACWDLTSVVIGDGVTTIDSCAFSLCESLTTIYYKGMDSNWNKMSIGWDNDYLINATRYYYSENEQSGCWHYDENGNVVLW